MIAAVMRVFMGAPKLTVVWGAAFPLEFEYRHFGADWDPPDKRFARGDNTCVALSFCCSARA